MKKLFNLMTSAIILLIILTACGTDNAESSNAESSNAENANTENANNSEDGNLKVAILLKTLSNPFWVDMKEGIEEQAKEQNIDVEVFAAESEEDVTGQLNKFEDIITSESYDGVGIAPITETNLISGVVSANEKNLPVVNIDAKINDEALEDAGGYVAGFATSDNYNVGEIGAEYFIDQLGSDGGEIAIIEGRSGDLSGILRRDGVKDVLEDTDGFSVVDVQPADWDRQKALDVATNTISKYPDLKGIFVANDTMALGALQAIKNAGKLDEILLVGTDASDETIESIDNGEMVSVVQKPANIGTTSLDILIDAIENDEGGSVDAEPEERLVDAVLYTEENVDELKELK